MITFCIIILTSVYAARVRSFFGRDVRLRACVFYEHMSVMPAGGGLGRTSTRLCARWSIGFALALYTPYFRMRELIMHWRLEFLPLLFYFMCREIIIIILPCPHVVKLLLLLLLYKADCRTDFWAGHSWLRRARIVHRDCRGYTNPAKTT